MTGTYQSREQARILSVIYRIVVVANEADKGICFFEPSFKINIENQMQTILHRIGPTIQYFKAFFTTLHLQPLYKEARKLACCTSLGYGTDAGR